MPLGESDTRAKLIDPALHACGWTEDLIRREETAGAESPQVFDTPDVARAGGLPALKAFGQPADILRQTKERLFAA